LTVSRAIGLCPALTLLEADPVHYDEQFSSILLALGNVSPVIEPVELGRVFVGVDGLERMYGGSEKQVEMIAQAVGRTGGQADRPHLSHRRWADRRAAGQPGSPFPTPPGEGGGHGPPDRLPACPPGVGAGGGEWSGLRLGWARGKFAAWVAASRAKPGEPLIVSDDEQAEFLRTQPVAALSLDPDTHRRLWQLELKTLGDLAALSEEALVSQFGREGRMAWQLAAGKITEPVIGREVPEPITASIDFPNPIADRQILVQALGKLIDQALRHPRRTSWRVREVCARAVLEHGSSWMSEVTLKDPSANREHIISPIRAKLEQAPPNGSVEHLTVEFTAFVRGTTELQLFARDAQAAARAGRRRALCWAVREIKTRVKRPMLHHIIEVHPWSRIPERRYALIDFDP
jgi:hypothetical protein